MAAITPIRKNLRPLPGSQVRNHVCGEQLQIGDWVVKNTSDRIVKHAGAAGKSFGMIVATSNKTDTAAIGESVAVCWFGPVAGFATLSPGRLTYLGAAGAIADTGTVPVGYNDSADVLIIMPGVANAAS